MKAPLLATFLLPAALAAQDDPWLCDFAKAKQLAAEKKRLILAYFDGSDWNKLCQQMRQEIFSQPKFLDWAKENVILLEVDLPKDKVLDEATTAQNAQLAATYKLTTRPLVLLLDSEGNVRGPKLIGYVSGGPEAFIPEVTKRMYWSTGGVPPKPSSAPTSEPEPEKKPTAASKPADAKPAGPKPGWLGSHAEALAKAKKDKKVVLAELTDHSAACTALEDEVFAKPEFKKWADKSVVLLELDAAKEEKLRKDLKVDSLPAVVFLDATGKKLGQLGREKGGAEAWTKLADKYVKRR